MSLGCFPPVVTPTRSRFFRAAAELRGKLEELDVEKPA